MMDDKDLELNQEDEFDPEELDFTLDGEEENTEDDEKDKEPVKEEEPEDVSASELARVRAEYDALKTKADRLESEREQASIREEEANRVTIQTAITQRQGDARREKDARRELTVALAEATANGDVEAIKKLTRSIGEKDDLIENAQNDISQWQPLLNNRVTPRISQQQEAKPEQWRVFADQWKSENAWVDDPKFKDKKDKALGLYNKLVADGYDHNKLSFWTHINNELKEFDKPKDESKRRTPPAVRPVSSQGALQAVSNKKKADSEILTAVHRALERRGISKSSPDFDKLQKSYYGTFKREIEKSRQTNG